MMQFRRNNYKIGKVKVSSTYSNKILEIFYIEKIFGNQFLKEKLLF